ncbi:c-type cytochrome [Caldimonas brevitalea]|uniref:Cytochrome C n=1 Tax=Caldimonas brevitalea TaxID=413882 RepID=A0A0G3BRP0_9BURK|nr:c-type cytochrome [Caldimonas brevitalea]AKJ30041.1 cytochrome C [Caldimonas brevitalea]
MKQNIFVTLIVAFVLACLAAAGVVWGGFYDISATSSHTQPVYSLLETAMRRSVVLRSRDIKAPPLGDAAKISRGAFCYRELCVQCHGGPGVAPSAIGMSLQPLPGPLIDAARRWRAEELYWITKHGVKMSGMPAWEVRLSEADLWSVVAFLQALPEMSPRDYDNTVAAAAPRPQCPAPANDATETAGGNPGSPAQARLLLRQYACVTCHVIPGVTGSDTQLGPPLAGLARRSLLPGGLANSEDNLVRWIRHPRGVDPLTAMPDLGVTEEHARQMAAYLLEH